MAATDIPAVLRDMERNELTDSQAYQSLRPHEGDTPKLGEIEPTADAIRSAAMEAQEIYHYMQLCNGLLIQKQIDSALAKYVDPDG